jgi:hypothetical protein
MKNNQILWYGCGVLALSFVLDLATKWFTFVPVMSSRIIFWVGLGILGIAVLLVIIERLKGFWKEVN